MTIEEATERIGTLARDVKDIRAERWLREWPAGNAETPMRMPDYVKDYEARHPRNCNPT